jgi:putative ABC transport system permease protein
VHKIIAALRNIFRRDRVERDLDAEIRSYSDMLEEEKVFHGMNLTEARRAARMHLGGPEQLKEEIRASRAGAWLESLWQDVRFAARILRKNPGFTAVAIFTLALGIGANTAVFSIVDAVLLRPLPYKDANRLVAVWATDVHQPGSKIFAPYLDFEEFKAHSQSFDELAALTWARSGGILTWQRSPRHVLAIPASADFFSLLGVPAALGRTFGPQDLQNGCTVVLAHSFWQDELGSSPGIVGSTLMLDGKPCAVSGVMPRGFDFYPKATSLWTLILPDSEFSQKPLDSAIGIFGRLKPGISLAGAEQELSGLHQRVIAQVPAGNWVIKVTPIVRDLREQFTWMAGRNLRAALLVLSAAAGLVLLIACLNVGGLLIGRSIERQRELAVRAALGSGRSRLIRQLLVESMLLAVLGMCAGILIAIAGVRYFNSVNLVELPPGNPVTVNLRVLGFTMLLTSLTGLFFGMMPARRASRIDLNEALKQSGRSATRGMNRRTPKWLIVGQVALSMILLAGAGLLIESIVRLSSVPLGFRPDRVLTAEVSLPPAVYSGANQRAIFYGKLIAGLDVLPGVEAVALCSSLPPYTGGSSTELAIVGKPPIESIDAVTALDIGGDYFRAFGIPLLRGREFDARDQQESQRVVIVNSEMARQFFPREDPVGARIKLAKVESKDPWLTVVGVVGDEKRTIVYKEMGYIEPPLVYLPVEQTAGNSMGMVIGAHANPLSLGPTLQGVVSRLDSDVPVSEVRTMEDRYSQNLAQPRFRAILMGILAGLTLLLASIGIYGVLAQSVSQRTQEIGIRLALGAQPSGVFGLILGEGMRLTLAGIVIGLLGAFGLTRFMSAMLYGVKATDPLVFAGVPVVLILVAFFACYIPARRTMRIDPMVALRYE